MIIKVNDLKYVRKNNIDKKIVVLKGSFDLLHVGHIYMMEQAKKYGDILVAIVKPDIAIKNKGVDRPIINENDRIKQVDSIKYIDYTILANQETNYSNLKNISKIQTQRYCEIIKSLHPNILVHPTNHKIPIVLENLYKDLNIEIIEIERDNSKPSTTSIINKIRKENINS